MHRQLRKLSSCIIIFVLILIIYYYSTNNYEDDLFSKLQETSPFHGPPIFFVIHDVYMLDKKMACAVEAAALHNPNSQVMLYAFHIRSENEILKTLKNISNVNVRHLSISQALNNTPLQNLFLGKKHGFVKSQIFRFAVELALLSKRGGTYISGDIWCVKPVLELRNTMFLEAKTYSIITALSFERWHRSLTMAMTTLRNHFKNSHDTDENILKNITSRSCSVHEGDLIALTDLPLEKCVNKNIIMDSNVIYPESSSEWSFVSPTKPNYNAIVLAIKLWNNFSPSTNVIPENFDFIETVAKKNCRQFS